MNCWICGSPANSGEHIVKASDLRACFGPVSQNDPIYVHTDMARNVRLRTIKDDIFKSNALLCSHCNNARTQPFDRAWEALSKALMAQQSLRPGQLIKLNKIFKRPAREVLLDVHLYFAKLFGCRIAESNIPIDLKPFSDAIMHRRTHPQLYLAIGPWPEVESLKKMAGVTEIHTLNNKVDGHAIAASWIYHVGILHVRLLYEERQQFVNRRHDLWHPDSAGRLLKMARFE
jgi:hypothetical protein